MLLDFKYIFTHLTKRFKLKLLNCFNFTLLIYYYNYYNISGTRMQVV